MNWAESVNWLGFFLVAVVQIITEIRSRYKFNELSSRLTHLETENLVYKSLVDSLEDVVEKCKMRVENLNECIAKLKESGKVVNGK